jgi:hypothetical protein
MITSEEAIKKLKEYWGTNKFVFQAEFHVPKNVSLREGTKPFGYFRNIRFNGELLEYPLDAIPTHERRVSIYQVLKPGLTDQEQYEVTLDLAKDDYRKKNPFQLVVKNFKKLANESIIIDTTLHKTIKDIFNENININSPFQVVNLANSVESLATDIYSEDKRFIYELIQNADDAAFDEDSELSIEVLSNYVIISHNGAPFNSRDIRGLCSIGIGTKTNDATKTGYKGIGFKSVFGQPDGLVYVKSEYTLFKFDREYSRKKGWNIKWGNKEEWEEKNGVTFNCPWQMMPVLIENLDDAQLEKVLANEKYTVKTAIKIIDSEQVFKNINKFFGDAKFLLFLRRITRVEIIFDKHTISFKKEKKHDHKEIVSLIKNNELLSNWYVKNWIHNIPIEIQKELKSDPKTPKKIQSMEKTEISFALEINDTLNEIKLLDEGKSFLYSYLPTEETQYNIPFIVNCNFLLDASREKIHKNRKWNEWLFQVIGYKTVECCYEFLVNNLFETTYLSIFRNGFIPESDNLRAKINAGLKIGLEKFAILKNRNNELCKLDEVALDRFNLFQVEPELVNKLAAFINETEEKVLLDAKNIIELSDLISHILKLKPFVISESILQDFFSSAYIEQVITLISNYKILSFLCPLETKDTSGTWYTVVTKYKLIINQDEQLDYIKRVCFPMELGESSYDTEFKNALIHHDVYQLIKDDVELLAWLIKLGVSEPGSIAYLEKEIIGNIQNVITNTNYLTITKFIYRLYTDKRLTEAHYVNLQELPLKTDKGFKKANLCVLPESYNPTIDIRSKLPAQAFLSDEYLEIANTRECKSFFKILAVRDDIEFTNKFKINSPDLPPSFVEVSNKFAREGHTYPHLIGVFHPNTPISNVPYHLQSFTFLDQINKFEFAIVFWNRIFDKYTLTKNREAKSPHNYAPPKDYTVYNLGGGSEFSTLDEMAWGRQPYNTTYIPSYFIWYIQNTKCIPTNKGLKLANETYTNTEKINELAGDFLPIIKIDKVVPEDWNKVLKMKSILSIDDLFTILNGISDLVGNKGFLDKENEKRLGLIYNELMLKINLDYENVSRQIKNWVSNGRLISSAKKSVKACDLMHIKIAGFENTNTDIRTIFLPKNVETNNPIFIDLLSVLGITIIDKFSYQADIINEIFDLKIKLLNLVGPVCLLLKNKMIVSDIDKSMYDRFIKISKTQFNLCNNIHPIFTNENEIIRGEIVNFYHDKVENKFLLSIDWQNPLTILEISYDLSSLLSAVRLEKEIMMLLSMSYSQIEQFLMFQKLDFKEYHNSEIYKEILNEIKKLEELKSIKPTKKLEKGNDTSSTNIKNDEDVPVEVKPLSGSMDETQEKIEAEQPKPKTIKDIIPDVTEEDEAYIKGIINFSYDTEGQMDANTTAKIKTLVAIKNEYATFNISDEGRFLKAGSDEILVRSAQNGLLYLDVYHWGRLNEANVRLSVYTKNLIEIFDSQEQLINYTKPQNKFGIVRMPNEYNLEDYNSLDNIPDKGKWHYVFIVNEKTKAAQNYKDVMNLDDYNF